MRSRETGFADETDLVTVPVPDPGTEPDYWLDSYPVLTEALAAADRNGMGITAEDAADLLADISSSAEPVTDSAALQIYISEYITSPE